jgi:hypothetical protein
MSIKIVNFMKEENPWMISQGGKEQEKRKKERERESNRGRETFFRVVRAGEFFHLLPSIN